MNGSKIIKEIEITEVNIANFIKNNNDSSLVSNSYSDWNAKDVIVHINEWIKYSKNKLYCIKNNKPLIELADYHDFNKQIYIASKDNNITQLLKDLNQSILEYKKIVQLFNNEELLSKDFPTGFSYELWRYMIMDGAIHPDLHLMFHYIKNKQYKEVIRIANETKKIFLTYSENSLDVYDFSDFIEDKKVFLNNIKELKENCGNDSYIVSIVDLNIKKNS